MGSEDIILKKLKFKKAHRGIKTPVYSSKGAACFDIHNAEVESITIQPGESAAFKTGLQFDIPEGYSLDVFSRSGHGFKQGLRLVNGTGIIDTDYTGEIGVKLHNDSSEPQTITPGERIAQARVVKADQWNLEEVEELKVTERGAQGFGSTGK